MKVYYTDFQDILGFNYKQEKPIYLLSPAFVVVEHNNYYLRFAIKKAFKSDGCTFKLRLLWLFFGCPHTGKYLPASIIHDYILNNPSVVNYNRNLSSKIFKEALLNEGVDIITATVFYFIVEIYLAIRNIFTKRWL